MSNKCLLLLFCCIGLTFSQSPGTRSGGKLKTSENDEQETSKDSIDSPNYGPLIEKIQNELNSINLDEISSFGTEIANTKHELSQINERITNYEQKQSNLQTIGKNMDTTNDVVNKLLRRMEKVESDININSKSDDTSYDKVNNNINIINKEINKLSSSMSREISDNTQRLEIIEENTNEYDKDIENIKKSIQQLTINIERAETKYDNTFKQIKDRFDRIDKSIGDTNKNLQIVYDSTIGAAMDKLISKILDYLADLGGFCVNIMEKIKNKILSINWKAYYNAITDPKQQQLFKDWLYTIYKYVTFWWINGIQPAIIRQATNLYFGIQILAKESMQLIHDSIVYKELIEQSKPYLKMGNIPMEYNKYIIDGLLVLFFVSSLITLSFIIGLCCDCCCPLKPIVIQPEIQIDKKKKKKNKRNNKRFSS